MTKVGVSGTGFVTMLTTAPMMTPTMDVVWARAVTRETSTLFVLEQEYPAMEGEPLNNQKNILSSESPVEVQSN